MRCDPGARGGLQTVGMVCEPLRPRERWRQPGHSRVSVRQMEGAGKPGLQLYLIHFPPNSWPLVYLLPGFQALYLCFSSYKKGRLEMTGKADFRVRNPPSSQITGPLHNVPMERQPLCC